MRMTRTTAVLAAATLLGLAIAVYSALTTPIIADAVNPGLYAYEWWHGNQQWYVPVNDPYVLDYLLNILVAPLFNYEPRALFIPGYLLYAGIVLLAGLTARRISGKTGDDGANIALAAMAIVANTGGVALQYTIYPVWHGSTLFLGLLAIYLYYGKPSPLRSVLMAPLLMFGVFCDTLFLPVFVAPLIAIETLRFYQASRAHEKYPVMVAPFVFAIFGYVIKMNGGEMWTGGPYLVNVGGLDMIMRFSPNLQMVLNYIDALLRMAGGPVTFTILVLAMYLAYERRRESRETIIFVVVASAAMFTGFLFLWSAGGDLGRYLYIVLPLAAIPAAMLANTEFKFKITKKTIGLYLILALVVAGVANNTYAAAMNIDDTFKKDASNFLVENNVTDGYADYWLANLMRYESNEQVRLRPVTYLGNTMEFLSLQSTDKWILEGWPNETAPTVDRSPTIVAYGQHDPCEPYVVWLATQGITPYETLQFKWHDPQTWEDCYLHVYRYNCTIPSGSVDRPYFERVRVKPV